MAENAIILAAGLGTRMHSTLPKCAHEVCGKPMVTHLVDTLNEVGIDNINVVVGCGHEVIENILKDRVTYSFQEVQLGTGHAVKCAKDAFVNKHGPCIIIPGDNPLVSSNTIREVLSFHKSNNNDLTIVTVVVDNPYGYGRIVKENGKVVKIVEEKDATLEEKEIKEINSAIYCVDIDLLFSIIDKIDNNNAKGEYYLTDIVKISSEMNKKIDTIRTINDYTLVGINDPKTLAWVEEQYYKTK